MNGAKFDAETARKHVAQIKDPDRNHHIVAALQNWIAAGAHREDGKWPTIPRPNRDTGTVEHVRIRQITLADRSRKPAIAIHDGDADRQTMVSVDVFQLNPVKRGARWGFVPIYLHQVLDRKGYPSPPQLKLDDAKITGKFCFSLRRGEFVEMDDPKLGMLSGYYLGYDINGGKLEFGAPDTLERLAKRCKTLLTIKKYSVDQFSRRNLVEREKRIWRGEVCTSPTPPG